MNHRQVRTAWLLQVVAFSTLIVLIGALPFLIGSSRKLVMDPALGFGFSLAAIVSGAVFTAKSFRPYLSKEPPSMLDLPRLFVTKAVVSLAFAEAGTLFAFFFLGLSRHPLFFLFPFLSLALIISLILPAGNRFFNYWEIQSGGSER